MSEESMRTGALREVFRELLEELLPQLVADAVGGRAARTPDGSVSAAPVAHANSSPVPMVPAPPVAAVYRPSTWTAPGTSATETAGSTPREEPSRRPRGGDIVEEVAIESDRDLEAFARRLLRLYENPRDRQALQSGQLRFALRRPAAPAPGKAAPFVRIEQGAVTERVVNEAAAAGTSLVLGPGAVLTPLARDRAAKLHVEIEREKRC